MHMEKPRKAALANLYNTATSQYGFFTTKQAESAGFSRKTHLYHVRAGNWIREHRAIYRLAQFPQQDRPDLMLWFLWSRNREDKPQGTYSHETALTLYGLSDVMPRKLHMTVPMRFRKNTPIPRALVLHRTELVPTDIETVHGVQVNDRRPAGRRPYLQRPHSPGTARRPPAWLDHAKRHSANTSAEGSAPTTIGLPQRIGPIECPHPNTQRQQRFERHWRAACSKQHEKKESTYNVYDGRWLLIVCSHDSSAAMALRGF
jgi:hypothetical protein